jgi:hypothetical protein
MRCPSGDVGRELFEHFNGALAAAVVDGLRHVEALPGRVEVGDQVGAQEVADVGDDPVVAGLYRLIGPQPVDAAPDNGHLGPDPVDQFPQRPRDAGTVGVGGPVHGGEQLPEPLRVVGAVPVV